jgi:eukaryotic-like serine/threonine-protein kinase
MSQPSKPFDVSRLGKVIAGRYEVERVLGVGGMGMVIRARNLEFGQRVVLKLVRPDVTHDSDILARFQREARATAGIQSEHVVRVFDVSRLEDGTPYMVMEYLDGADLDKVLRSRGPLPVSEVAEYILQACEAVAEAHARGIVHRDLKPANLFLTQRADGTPLVKVLDFGISKLTRNGGHEVDNSLTSTSAVLGSPQYMSPEQIRSSKTVDSRTDVWALGVLLHRLLTKRQPFEAPTLGLCVSNILNHPPTPLRDHRPNAPPELEALIYGCLEKDVALRYQSVADVARGLVPFAPARARISFENIVRVMRGVGVIVERIATSPSSPSEGAEASTNAAFASSAQRPLSELMRPAEMPASDKAEPSISQGAQDSEERAFNSSRLKRAGLLRTLPLSAMSSALPSLSSAPSGQAASSAASRPNGPSPRSQHPTTKSRRVAPSRTTSLLPLIIGGLAFAATISVGLYAVMTFYGGPSKDAMRGAPSASALQKALAPSIPDHAAPTARVPQGHPTASGSPPAEPSASAPVEASPRPRPTHGRR